MKDKKFEIKYLNKDLIEKNCWNPNRESESVFQRLVASIKEEGCDEPILVVKLDTGNYRIIGGEHRYKAMLENDYTEIPCVIRDEKEWLNENKQRIETVKRNMLHGELDDELFSINVNTLRENMSIEYDELSYELGFQDMAHFLKHYKEEREDIERDVRQYTISKDEKEDNGNIIDRNSDKITKEDNVKEIVNDIINQYGSQLEQGLLYFFFAGKMNLYLEMSDSLNEQIQKMVEFITANRMSGLEFLETAIKNYLAD